MNLLEGRRALIVEDEMIVAMMLEDMLVDMGAQVVGAASTIEEALALMERHEIDVAVLDVNLNGTRSVVVAEALDRRGIPFICATGYARHDFPGFETVPVLQKPYRREQVEAKLAEALRRRSGPA